MKIKIKRIDKSLPLPGYKTKEAAGFDVYARETVLIKPKEIKYVPLNVVLEIPKNAWVLLAPRSSTHKLGIMLANSIGIGDPDFCGDGDEYRFPAFNFTDKEVVIGRGTRLAQMIVLNYQQVEFEEVDSLKNKDRGGIGSTGLT